MHHFDLCFAWSWPYDHDFARLLRSACQAEQVTLLQITPDNIQAALDALQARELTFCAFFDRASDDRPGFLPLAEWAYQHDLVYFNRFWLARRSWDKATMHHQFTRAGLDAPYTVILPSFEKNPNLPLLDLEPFADQYAIKPAHGGGGTGVVVGALSWGQILQIRQERPGDQYLLQARVIPDILQNRPAWFRVISCLEKIYLCWWDPVSHIYTLATEDEVQDLGLFPLKDICQRIAGLSHLELFSTEIAISNKRFMVVDYINDPIDLRPRSSIPEGVPDSILIEIAQGLTKFVSKNCK